MLCASPTAGDPKINVKPLLTLLGSSMLYHSKLWYNVDELTEPARCLLTNPPPVESFSTVKKDDKQL